MRQEISGIRSRIKYRLAAARLGRGRPPHPPGSLISIHIDEPQTTRSKIIQFLVRNFFCRFGVHEMDAYDTIKGVCCQYCKVNVRDLAKD